MYLELNADTIVVVEYLEEVAVPQSIFVTNRQTFHIVSPNDPTCQVVISNERTLW
jgi:hypothetical protein